MEKEWVCECGVTPEGDSDEELAGKAREHARKDHRKKISQEEARKEVTEQHP